jgi:translation initiation factor 4E
MWQASSHHFNPCPSCYTAGEWFCRQAFSPELLDLYWQNLVLAVIGEAIEDSSDISRTNEDHINGVRVLDKSRNYPLFKVEIWINTRDEFIVDGQPAHDKTVPKFEWKDHS